MGKELSEELSAESVEKLSKLAGVDSRELNDALNIILDNKSTTRKHLYKKYRKIIEECKDNQTFVYIVNVIMLRENRLLERNRPFTVKDINFELDNEIERY